MLPAPGIMTEPDLPKLGHRPQVIHVPMGAQGLLPVMATAGCHPTWPESTAYIGVPPRLQYERPHAPRLDGSGVIKVKHQHIGTGTGIRDEPGSHASGPAEEH
ncbi:hypothetical protein BOW51_01315 [Solemya velesiana gill symbiont]|uniref:Uncharacterized protein n=1 Tax=Solemya velesiana gill symbiont TaxID=1918948 RepID=A0A1T2KXW6_9GAMM|nr:hypothetical protein BOW51_01315 [Solemya velesiana gill symbiont]